jgi:hypothetical protein
MIMTRITGEIGAFRVNDKNILQNIRDKEMDRKDFLKYSGVVLLGVVGLKGILTLLAPSEKPVASTVDQQKRGFGAGRYGA